MGTQEVNMNKVTLIGRLTRDPEVRYGNNNTAIARYTLAVDRRFKGKDGEQNADFISCVAFGKTGEFAEKYLHKGTKVAVMAESRQEATPSRMVRRFTQQTL